MSYKKNKFLVQRKVKAFRFLMDTFELSMKDAQRWIDKKRLIVNGKVLSKKSTLIDGEVEVIVFETTSRNLHPIFETTDFAIYDKPSGVLVHPSTRYTTYSLTHELKHRFGNIANITHRIDKETSGIVIVSKNKLTEKSIKSLFETKKVKKTYLAYVKGKINNKFMIDAPILKNSNFDEIKLKCIIDQNGKASQTIIEPVTYDKDRDITLIKATPLTGRQHQIRLHLFHVNHPIIGDPIYGVDVKVANDYLNSNLTINDRIKYTGAKRLMLHANSVELFYKNHFKIYSKDNFTF